jgi:hypothetical protein
MGLLELLWQKFSPDEFQALSLDHHIIVEATVRFVRTGVNLQETTVRTKLHSFRVLAPVLFQPAKGKSGHAKPVVDLTVDGIYDDESVAIRATPPPRDGVVTGKFHMGIRASPDYCPEGAPILGDDRLRGLAMIKVLDRVIAKPWTRLLYLFLQRKQTRYNQEDRHSHSEDSVIFYLPLQRKALTVVDT